MKGHSTRIYVRFKLANDINYKDRDAIKFF